MQKVIHLNDYPFEKQLVILKNFLRSFLEPIKTIPEEKLHVTIKSTIKHGENDWAILE